MKNNISRYQSMLWGLTAGMTLSTPVLAGDMLDEVTVTATRLETRIGDVPVTVSRYSSERIDT